MAGVALVRGRPDALKWLAYAEPWRDAADRRLVDSDEPIDLASGGRLVRSE
jgi:hypothetical protein